jgi:hypothetical protein
MKEEIYVSLQSQSYRKSKSNILLAQSELLYSIKRIHRLRALIAQKAELKLELKALMSLILLELKALKHQFPNPSIPKELQYRDPSEKTIKQPKLRPKKKHLEIDEELQLINEKLQQLNS